MSPSELTVARPLGFVARVPAHFSPRAAGAFTLSFALVVYLSFAGGGYDPITRGEVGIAVWWLVILGSAVGVMPLRSLGRSGWWLLGLFAAYAGWTALALTWTGSPERTHEELARVAMYLGVLALALGGRRDWTTVRPALSGLAYAIVLVTGAAVLSRLYPAWFPANDLASFLPGVQSRLAYPLNYWNALAALAAFGLPLVLAAAYAGRTILGRALAAGSIPVLALCGYLTYSRGGVAAAAIGLGAYFILVADRLPKLATALTAATGSALVIAAAHKLSPIADGVRGGGATSDANHLFAVLLVVCVAVALLHTAIGLAAPRIERPAWFFARRRRNALLAGGIAAVFVAIGIAAGGLHETSRLWRHFKQAGLNVAPSQISLSPRFGSASGAGRYQAWQAALHQNSAHPVRGAGPGTFQFWWQQHGSINNVLRNAHSLFFETLGELGIIGLLLLYAFLLTVLVLAARRSLQSPAPLRTWLAAGAAACAAFCASTLVDWGWQVAVLPIAFLLVAAAVVGGPSELLPRRTSEMGRGRLARVAVPAVGVAAVVAIALPLTSSIALRNSQRAAGDRQLSGALQDAQTAAAAAPYAATPRLQEALVLEQARRYPDALVAARAAVAREPADWGNWLVLSRIEAENHQIGAAVHAFARARSLNPRSVVFSQ